MPSIFHKARELLSGSAAKQELPYILAQAESVASFEARLDWMEMLITWLRAPISAREQPIDPLHMPAIRLKFLLQVLDRNPAWSQAVARVWAGFFEQASGFNLFTYAGLLEGKGFLDQVTDLVVERMLPLAKPEGDIEGLMARLFTLENDAEWMEVLPESLMHDVRQLMEGATPLGARIWRPLLQDAINALHVLALQSAALGMSESIWNRLDSRSPATTSFVRLQDAIRILADHLRQDATTHAIEIQLFATVLQEINACYHSVDLVVQILQTSGVNMGLTFRLQHQILLLQRLQTLTESLEAIYQGESMRGVRMLLCELIRALSSQQGLGSLLHDNAQLLALRVVEHAGNSGEHYITRNRTEYWSMLRSAAGGGALTVGTTCLKFGISSMKAPPFIEVLGHWLNYSGSFLLMQACHFTLATKQPSMTASALARKLSLGKGPDTGLALASEIRLIVRSQFAAALGNIGLAIPTAFLVAWGLMHWQGKPLFPLGFSQYTVHSLHPLKTLTLFYAALTGGLLWISSLCAGWVENWVAFQKIPNRLRHSHRLKRVFGSKSGERCAVFLSRHISGIAGNITLGFLLALLPFLGRILGLPLDVRHVTLSSAQLAMAVYSAGEQIPHAAILWAASGVIGTGLLNFGVSFWLALSVAMRAQKVRRSVKKAVMKKLILLFEQQPFSFFVPTRSSSEES